jgi:hypothetical protein
VSHGWRASALATLAALIAASCGGHLSGASSVRVQLGREFTVSVGQSVLVGDTGLRVAVRAVANDSRCPTDVQCVWEGDATVAIEVTSTSGGSASFELHTSGRFTREATHQAYRVALVRLDPSPHTGVTLTPSDYRVTFLVAR